MRQTESKYVGMTEDLQKEAIDCAIQAMNNYNAEKDIASYIKRSSIDFTTPPGNVSLAEISGAL